MKYVLLLFWVTLAGAAHAQSPREDIYTDFVLYNKRVALEKDLRERVVARHFSAPLDSNTEDGYLSACWAVEQFLFHGPEVMQGFDHLFMGYDRLSRDTKQAFLEAVYAVAPGRYQQAMEAVFGREADARLFAICAAYQYREDSGTENANALKIRMVERFPGYDTLPVLQELQRYLGFVRPKMPPLADLLEVGRGPKPEGAGGPTRIGFKTIYSFQRWDRDYPGLAVVQNADGSFVRDADGRLEVFEQLARSGPGLPYFLTNGNTPQGVYSITGTDVSRTNFIGPTPNLQLLLPGEDRWNIYFHDSAWTAGDDSLGRYQALLPPGWRSYSPMMEAWAAGAIGRTAIIAHGTTIDPEYFADKPFYPLTPTMGCLCSKELWSPTTGHLLVSEQNNLVNAFLSTPGRKGYLVVVNVDDQRRAVSREEIERFINKNPRR